ncbi:MAG: hypothetical protein IJJ69_00905 [Oscillospiraceae bacterium]|nr:hypothetical protein [Oscillospiraceae bacterium]
MKRKFCLVLIAGFCLLISGCSESIPETAEIPVTESETIPETTVPVTETETIPETTEVPETESETTPETESESETQDSAEYEEERKLMEDFCTEFHGALISPYPVLIAENTLYNFENEAVWFLYEAEKFPERILGTITSEEDLITKVRPLFIEKQGEDYINRIESDYVDVDGVKMKYERMYPPYGTEYYEKFDIWYIQTNAPMGTREDGVMFATPAQPPYFLIRGSDGKIMGYF